MWELIGRAIRAVSITFIALWLVANVLKVVFDFWFMFWVLAVLVFIIGL